jgi:hypothetical protein
VRVTSGGSFDRVPVTNGPRNRRVAGLVVALLVLVIGVAIAKPWTTTVAPASPTPGVSGSPLAPSASGTTSASGPAPPSAAAVPSPASPTAIVPSAADPFETPVPPAATATWTGLRWRVLAPDDPLSLVTSALRWRGGFIALGRQPSPLVPDTPVWTSQDGAHWTPLWFNTSTTFWPGTEVGSIAEVRGGVVAMTQLEAQSVLAWTSADGHSWGCACSVPLPAETPGPPLLAAGPTGLVAASTTTGALATSPDGSHWTVVPDRAHPSGFSLADLRGTATGYVAGGELNGAAATLLNGTAATLWSADGRSWVATTLPLTAPGVVLPRTGPASTVTSLVVGRSGLIAEGGWQAIPGGATLWWQSSDGRHWRLLDGYPPLGPTTCTGEGCGGQPDGVLVGDGQRMVAVRGGQDAGAWTSSDGRAWRRLSVTGDVPDGPADPAVLLPGGVLLSDGSTTWFGEALAG